MDSTVVVCGVSRLQRGDCVFYCGMLHR